jgi:hypothetical protein
LIEKYSSKLHNLASIANEMVEQEQGSIETNLEIMEKKIMKGKYFQGHEQIKQNR